jgi:hypothetical protein
MSNESFCSRRDNLPNQSSKNSLTVRAKAVQLARKSQHRPKDQEEIDLALAWLRDEVRLLQVCEALGHTRRQNASGYTFLATALKAAYRTGQIQLNPKRRKIHEEGQLA